MTGFGGLALVRIVVVTVVVTIVCAVQAAMASAAFTIPAGGEAVLSNATFSACHTLAYGYQLNGVNQQVDVKALTCQSNIPGNGATIGPVSSDSSLLIYLEDQSCPLPSRPPGLPMALVQGPNATYYSDGTGTANHASISGANPFLVAMQDGGPNGANNAPCSLEFTSAPPVQPANLGNFHVLVTIKPAPPPTVSVSAPSAPAGQNGYFNSHDIAVAGGSVPVRVSAQPHNGVEGSVTNLSCTDNGAPVTVKNQSGGAPRTGLVLLAANGVHSITCTATDSSGDSGNFGGQNTAIVNIDTNTPSLAVPSTPVGVVAVIPAGVQLASYPVTASDSDAGDTPSVRCTPAPPAQFPVGDTTVSCQATDRAGNFSGAKAFVVHVTYIRVRPSVDVTCSPGTLAIGQSTTCTATVNRVARPGFDLPTGAVTFTTPSGSPLSGGGSCELGGSGSAIACSMTFRLTSAAIGTFPIAVLYSGDAAYAPVSLPTSVASVPASGKTANVAVVSGTVFIRLPGGHASDGGGESQFVPLKGQTVSVPVGATVDARKGVLRMSTAADFRPANDPRHSLSTGTFSAAIFTIEQLTKQEALARAKAEHKRRLTGAPSTDMVLSTPVGGVAQARCRRTGAPGKGVVRALTGTAKGFYRTIGANSVTTVHDATWVVQDRCDGTFTEVGRGHATVTLRHSGGKQPRSIVVGPGQGVLIKGRFA